MNSFTKLALLVTRLNGEIVVGRSFESPRYFTLKISIAAPWRAIGHLISVPDVYFNGSTDREFDQSVDNTVDFIINKIKETPQETWPKGFEEVVSEIGKAV